MKSSKGLGLPFLKENKRIQHYFDTHVVPTKYSFQVAKTCWINKAAKEVREGKDPDVIFSEIDTCPECPFECPKPTTMSLKD